MEALLLVVVLVAIEARVWWVRRGWLRSKTRREVAVHLVDGSSLRGVLWSVSPDVLVLHAAKVLDSQGDPLPVDGDVAVPRGRVSWVQVLAAPGVTP